MTSALQKTIDDGETTIIDYGEAVREELEYALQICLEFGVWNTVRGGGTFQLHAKN
jgi:hypothetical protein